MGNLVRFINLNQQQNVKLKPSTLAVGEKNNHTREGYEDTSLEEVIRLTGDVRLSVLLTHFTPKRFHKRPFNPQKSWGKNRTI